MSSEREKLRMRADESITKIPYYSRTVPDASGAWMDMGLLVTPGGYYTAVTPPMHWAGQ